MIPLKKMPTNCPVCVTSVWVLPSSTSHTCQASRETILSHLTPNPKDVPQGPVNGVLFTLNSGQGLPQVCGGANAQQPVGTAGVSTARRRPTPQGHRGSLLSGVHRPREPPTEEAVGQAVVSPPLLCVMHHCGNPQG